MSRQPLPQLDLFGDASDPARRSHAVHPAQPDRHVLELAERLPAAIRLGTSSWHFPGWARLVYDHAAEERVLARDGLSAYAQHPLLRCVSLDRTFYAPIGVSQYRAYADQVPGGFRFMVKAPLRCTAAFLRARCLRAGGQSKVPGRGLRHRAVRCTLPGRLARPGRAAGIPVSAVGP